VYHINKIVKKIKPYVGMMSRTRQYLLTDHLKKIFFAYIHSNIHYLISAYAAAPSYSLTKIETVRKKGVKYVFNLKMDHPTNTLFRQNIYSLEKIIKIDMVILVFKIKHNLIKNNSVMHTRGFMNPKD
jgi:hypothetical protein